MRLRIFLASGPHRTSSHSQPKFITRHPITHDHLKIKAGTAWGRHRRVTNAHGELEAHMAGAARSLEFGNLWMLREQVPRTSLDVCTCSRGVARWSGRSSGGNRDTYDVTNGSHGSDFLKRKTRARRLVRCAFSMVRLRERRRLHVFNNSFTGTSFESFAPQFFRPIATGDAISRKEWKP